MITKEEYIGRELMSKHYGPYIIKDIININNIPHAKILFLNNKSETITRLTHALNNEVRDPQYGLDFNKIYYSDNYGPYIIKDIFKGARGKSSATIIKFLLSNGEKIVSVDKALRGEVSDKSINAVSSPLDTSCLDTDDRIKRINRLSKNLWCYMMYRCYDDKKENYASYGALGIKVCDRWLNIDNFISDLPSLFQYDKWYRYPTVYRLDKDYLQLNIEKEKRIYSKDTCVFLHKMDNINLKCIEYKRINNTLTNYIGVVKAGNGKFGAQIVINNKNYWLGTFSNEIAAANAYNYYYNKYCYYELIPLLNKVPYMPPNEFIKYNVNPKTMCNIIERKNS